MRKVRGQRKYRTGKKDKKKLKMKKKKKTRKMITWT